MSTSEAYEHDRTVTAFFDTRAAAEKAKANVIAVGVPNNRVTVVEGRDRTASDRDPARSLEPHQEGFWESLKNIFAPEEDRHVYAEGLSRGGFLVTAHTNDAHYDRVIDILDDEGAVNMDERETQWRNEGWSGRHDGAPAVGSSMAAARGMETPVATRAETSQAATRGTASPTGFDNTLGSRDPMMTRESSNAGARTPVDAPPADAAIGSRDGLREESIPLAEESLRVGKRDLNHGRVRLRSYVVEKPVHESVNLHSENVEVSRRPVDRALAAGENLFQERTISAEGHHEEAVVSKEARVYEEIGLTRTAQDNVQEVNETVRRTEAEVADDRIAGEKRGLGGGRTGVSGVEHQIAEHMEVRDSAGTKVGTVDHYDGGDKIKLSKHDSPDGIHHFIPTSWIAHTDEHVHLTKSANDVRSGWTAA